jgi:hypothetical protein
VIDRRDHVINLCEIKYSVKPFTIDKSYAEKPRNKIGLFREATRTRKSVFLTMITTYGIKQNAHSAALVQNSLTMDALFEKGCYLFTLATGLLEIPKSIRQQNHV